MCIINIWEDGETRLEYRLETENNKNKINWQSTRLFDLDRTDITIADSLKISIAAILERAYDNVK